MDRDITKKIWQLRNEEKVESYPHPVNLIYTGGRTYQLYFATVGCSRACTMCYYGVCREFDEEKARIELQEMEFPEKMEILVLEASGSLLDEREISKKLRNEIFHRIAEIKTLKYIIIETHYTTVTEEALKEISKAFEGYPVEIEFEFGIESVNQEVLKFYNKDINLQELIQVVKQAKKYNIRCEFNLLLGAPELSVKEQIEDILNSVKWMLENCPEETMAVLFPINIKKFTLLWELYKKGRYAPVYHWAFIEVLDNIPVESLDRISIAWWGNRFNVYDGEEKIIYPYSCDKCHDELQNFYANFYAEKNAIKRKELLKNIKKIHCECRREFLEQFSRKERLPSKRERFECLKQWLKTEELKEN